MSKKMFCLICKGKKNLKDMGKDHSVNGTIENYADILVKCFNIYFFNIWDNFENKICETCIYQLKIVDAFRNKVVSSYDILYDNDKFVSKDCQDKGYKNYYKTHTLEIEYDNPESGEISDDNQSTTSEEIKRATGYYKVRKTEQSYVPHLDPTLLQCPVCLITFESYRLLHPHYYNHFPTHLCHICGQTFLTTSPFNIHMNIHMNKKYPCTLCNKVYRTKPALNVHTNIRHKNKNPTKCNICKEEFRSWRSRLQHLASVHGQDIKMNNCTYCEKSFITVSTMKQHIRLVHLKQMDYICNICEKPFYSKQLLLDHIAKHTGSKRNACEFCGRILASKRGLKEHYKIHLEDKNFKCDDCGKTFVQKSGLQTHLRVHNKTLL